jgi:hypothetical protein
MLNYRKRGPRPDSLLAIILSTVQLLLVLAGLVGISVLFFRDKGWLKQTLSSILDASTSTLVIALPVALLVFLFGKFWLDSQSERKSFGLTGDFMLYLMMMAGAWFIYSYIVTSNI